jgi:hypothetical protein
MLGLPLRGHNNSLKEANRLQDAVKFVDNAECVLRSSTKLASTLNQAAGAKDRITCGP